MKASRFNLFFPVGNGRVVAYNTRTGSLLSLTGECYEAIARCSGSYEHLSLALTALLAEFGFAVPDSMDELRAIRHEMMRNRYDRRYLSITVVPTLDCNLRCVYCYEEGVRREGTMSTEVERALLSYLETNAPVSGEMHLSWYGGEPLMCPDIVV